jgi:NADPH-dependent curcumin reductase CurA
MGKERTTPLRNRRIVLAARPKGEPKDEDFRLEEVDLPVPGEGQALLRTIYLSLDPYMRGRMNAGPSYVAALEIGDLMEGRTVSEVVEARTPVLHPGDVVAAHGGWQQYSVEDARTIRKLDPSVAPVSANLGVLGMPGLTAYTGLMNIGQPKAGETLVVAGAAGAVGSVVGQIAKIAGCRVVGVAGSPEKCEFVTRELGFDACVSHRDDAFEEELRQACPNGVDIYFENVGGRVLRAVLPLMNLFGRVPVCGLISQYNMSMPPRGVDRVPMLMTTVLTRRLTLRGFIVGDFAAQRDEFRLRMSAWLREGRVRYREDVVDGLENAVAAFQGLFRGSNLGKLLVRVGRSPSVE